MPAIIQEVLKLRPDVPLEKQLDLVRLRHDALVENRATLAEQLENMDAEIEKLAKVLEEHPLAPKPFAPPEIFPT